MKKDPHPNFSVEEMRCRDGTPVPEALLPNAETLLTQLQVLRDELGVPVLIPGAYRSPEYNEELRRRARIRGKKGPAKRSQHIQAKAADIRVPGKTPTEVHLVVLQLIATGRMMQGGVGLYPGWVHYDCRGRKARWRG